MKKASIAALAFVALCANATDPDWQFLTTDSDFLIWLDRANIRTDQFDKGARTAWVRFDVKESKTKDLFPGTPNHVKYTRNIQQVRIHCTGSTIAQPFSVFYLDNKSVYELKDNPFDSAPIIPGTTGDKLFKAVC